MEDKNEASLEERIEKLEKALFRIEQVILRRQRQRKEAESAVITQSPRTLTHEEESRAVESDSATAELSTPAHHLESAPSASGPLAGRSLSSIEKLMLALSNTEDWFNKIGSALLFFGLIFLFKYSVDQGWLTPLIRILFGACLGIGLIAAGDRLVLSRRRFSLFLFGSGVVSLYTTCFAAYQIFELISSPVAFGIMIAISAFSFTVSVSMDEAIPALLATVGGFATPFLLYSETGSVPGLMVYISVMMAGCLGVYWYRGWRPLLLFSFVGAGIVLLLTVGNLFLFSTDLVAGHRIPVQSGIIFGWLLFAALPILREASSSVRACVPGITVREISDRMRRDMSQHLNLFVPVVGLLVLLISLPIWDVERRTWGIIILVYAAVYGIASFLVYRSEETRPYTVSHVIAAVIFFTISLFVLFRNETLILAVTFEAMVLHAAARQFNEERAHIAGHLVSILVAIVMLNRLLESDLELFNPISLAAATNLVVLICGFLISRLLPGGIFRVIYVVVVHIGALMWFTHELLPVENGQALISISWGVYAVVLFVAGLRIDSVITRRLGLATLALVVGKLFLIDLAQLEMIWRVIVFLGFGGGFLVLSYLFKTLRKTEKPGAAED